MNIPFKIYDDRRQIAVAQNSSLFIKYAIEHLKKVATQAIKEHGYFTIALSGGSTPKAIFEALTRPENKTAVNWEKSFVFWSDERVVSYESPESNFGSAMAAGLKQLNIPKGQIFPMPVLENLTQGTEKYQELILKHVPNGKFDLMMLGMGDDAHTASLFPHTDALKCDDKLVAANFIPQKNIFRMTLTYTCINQAKNIVVYVSGQSKADALQKVLYGPYNPLILPIQKVGTPLSPAFFILDQAAASKIIG